MTTAEILHESLWTHEVLRRLGFRADDIFFQASVPLTEAPAEFLGKIQVSVVLRAQCREFVITIGFVEGDDRENVFAAWQALVHKFNAQEGGAEAWEEGYSASLALKQAIPIGLCLMEKGFVLPKLSN